MADLRQVVFFDRPNLIFPAISTVLALFALSPTPSFIPLTLLVATLLVYTRISIRRPHAPRTILGTFFGISLASTLSHIIPSIHALSSTPLSIISLWIISSLSSVVAFGTILLSLRLNIPWTKITFFPAIWTTTWQAISHTSPVGHLVTWSPVTGIASYEWMRPLFGTWGINWLVGAYAVVIAELVGAWFIGPVEDFEPHGPLISNLVSNGDSQESQPDRPVSLPRAHHTFLLGTALLGLTLQSFLLPTVPTLPWSTSSTPFPVGCVLPHPSLPDDKSTPLDRFIAESKQHNGARLLLWPEGALRFETTTQREEAINKVQKEIHGPFVGVTFTEPVPPSAEWEHSREGKWRNGLVLVGPKGPVAEFYKRNLVPIAESFSLTESKEDPVLYDLELHGPNKNKKWTPAPPYDRTVPLTAAICLDFSSPTIFTSLHSRPALILAPAQTWQRDVSMAMWEQARARAEEAGSMVLFCDGGAEGASGVAGHGIREPVQFGSGSWTRTVGVAWPFNQHRTLYMWGGGALPFSVVWLLVGAGWVLPSWAALGGFGGVAVSFSRLREVLGRARAYIRRPAPPTQGEQQPLLL
ncbi:hypothetical protein BJV78DRAFT_1116525 [Lactifluus subvellereus]|nr:hypothetical protein BJV78DRAFT_1116525 [Lactifluus subvellereus]